METGEINKALKGVRNYKGCYPSNKLPKVEPPCYFVVNTDPSDKAGEHWVVVAILKNKKAYYFDSFGFPPLVPAIASYLNKNSSEVTYNSATLQHPDTKSCGLFCIDFIRKLSSGCTYKEYIQAYTRNLGVNEKRVVSSINKRNG